MHLIGINGLKTSGKDTTGRIVQHLYGDGDANVVRAGFADKLKIMAAKALGLDGTDAELIARMDEAKESWVFTVKRHTKADVQGPMTVPGRLSPGWAVEEPVTNFTGRQYLQWFGGRARQVFGDTFWIDQVLPTPTMPAGMMPRPKGLPDPMGLARVQGRYPDADALVITDVRYPNEAQRVKDLGGVVWNVWRPGLSSDGHDSEVPLPAELIDWVIPNDGSLSALEGQVERALDTL